MIPELKGDTSISATASQSPRQIGAEAVTVGHAILNGKTPGKTTDLIAPQLVTRDNVGSYSGW